MLTHNPSVFLLRQINAAQLSLATSEPDYVRNALSTRYAGGVFLHWNFWCNVDDPAQQAFCNEALEQFPHDLVGEHRERNYRYGFYKLTFPAEDPSAP